MTAPFLAPKLALNLTTGSLDPAVDLTRAGTATAVNSSGLVAVVSANSPRFDYNAITLACKGLLIEESRANQALSSDAFNAANWVKTRTTVTADAIVSPSGATDADKVVDTAVSGTHAVQTSTLLTISSVAYSGSVYAKAGERTWIVVGIGTTVSGIAYFNLSNGTIGTVTAGFTASITPAGNGWYRCSVSGTISAANQSVMAIYLALANNSASYVGDGTSGAYVWGAQLEAGSFPTSYIPTTTAAVTRNADVATITGTAFSGIWRSGPGSILVRALPSTVSGTRPLVQVDDATADNIIALRGNATNPELYIRAGGSDQATIDAGTISAAAYRLAGAWQAGSAAASLNSGLAINGAPASIPAVTQMRLGSDGTNYLNGHLQAVQYWPVRLSNASLQNASSTAGYQSIIHPVLQDTIITEPV